MIILIIVVYLMIGATVAYFHAISDTAVIILTFAWPIFVFMALVLAPIVNLIERMRYR